MLILQLLGLKLEENTIELSPKLDRERAKDPLCFGQTLRKLKKMKDETEKQNSYNLTPPDGVGYIERHTGDMLALLNQIFCQIRSIKNNLAN